MLDGKIADNEIQDPWAIRTGVPRLSRDPGRTPMQWILESDTKHSFGFSPKGVKPWLPVRTDHPEV